MIDAPAPLPLDEDEPVIDDDEPVITDDEPVTTDDEPTLELDEPTLDLDSARDADGDMLDAPRVPGDTDGDGLYEPEIDPGNTDAEPDGKVELELELDVDGRSATGRGPLYPPVRSIGGTADAAGGVVTAVGAGGKPPVGPGTGRAFEPAAHAAADAPPLGALDTLCVVALRDRRYVPADPAIKTVHEGRTYFFSTPAAKAAFVKSPAEYAPAFCGMDPVAYLDGGEVVEGTVLRRHGDRFYLFVQASHWEAFQKHPERYSRD